MVAGIIHNLVVSHKSCIQLLLLDILGLVDDLLDLTKLLKNLKTTFWEKCLKLFNLSGHIIKMYCSELVVCSCT